jgi:hypothetical protein
MTVDSSATAETERAGMGGTERAFPDASDAKGVSGPGGSSTRSSTAELGAISLALVLGGLGFGARVFWIAAMVLMAVALGLLLEQRKASRGGRGVVPEIVAAR